MQRRRVAIIAALCVMIASPSVVSASPPLDDRPAPIRSTFPRASHSLFGTGPVTVAAGGYLGWALLDRSTGKITASANATTVSDTASMIKPWLVADYLRIAAADGVTPDADELHQLSIAIRDSDNDAATATFRAVGGTASLARMIDMCGLTDSYPTPGEWSRTYLSPRDAVRMADCIAGGTAAGPKWTEWVLDQMRQVRGASRFGIIDALPPAEVATTGIKNGYLIRDDDGRWHMSCLAVGTDWALAIMMRYPAALGFEHGKQVCRDVTSQLLRG